MTGSPGYDASVEHHFENGIKEVTPYVLEPGSELDLIVLVSDFWILVIMDLFINLCLIQIYLLALRKLAFAVCIPLYSSHLKYLSDGSQQVKSGGHISIPKIYPPDGVLISMKQFNQITYNEGAGTLDVGAGVTWGDVYNFLDTPEYRKLGVVGGDPLVGVSGWLLGGGYSLLTNTFGLGMDNVVGFQVLTPSATSQLQDLPNDPTIRNANAKENVDLFKALKVCLSLPIIIIYNMAFLMIFFLNLKGGGHNFGIVTRFTLQAYHGAERVSFLVALVDSH